jgi:hypothetical protein
VAISIDIAKRLSYNLNMLYGSAYEDSGWGTENAEVCGNCRKPSDDMVLLTNGWNFKACPECAELCHRVEVAEPCPDLHRSVVTANSIDEVRKALRAHQGIECVHCSSTKKTVAGDRMVGGSTDAICCETTARKEVA